MQHSMLMTQKVHLAAVHAVGHVAKRDVMDVVSPLIEKLKDKEIRHAALEALVKVSAAVVLCFPRGHRQPEVQARQHLAAVHAVGHVAERCVMDVVSLLIKELEDETKFAK